jgi:hypothetical protein
VLLFRVLAVVEAVLPVIQDIDAAGYQAKSGKDNK